MTTNQNNENGNCGGNNGRVFRAIGNIVVEGFYNHQEVRLASMNQIRDVVRRIREGIPWDRPEEKKEQKSFSKEYADDNLLGLVEEMFEQRLLSQSERDYIVNALEIANAAGRLENSHKPLMRRYISNEPIWQEFLIHVRGIADVLGSNIVSKLGDCSRFKNISSLWRYCGYHLVCPVCTEDRVVGPIEDDSSECSEENCDSSSGCVENDNVEPEDNRQTKKFPVLVGPDGKCPICGLQGVGEKRASGQGIDFNPSLRKLMFKIGDCFIKLNSPIYREIYDEHKESQRNRFYPPGLLLKLYPSRKKGKDNEAKSFYKETDTKLSAGHAHARAIRKMMKVFLAHYWIAARTVSGLSVTDPYVQQHMGHTGIYTWKDVVRANGGEINPLYE